METHAKKPNLTAYQHVGHVPPLENTLGRHDEHSKAHPVKQVLFSGGHEKGGILKVYRNR